MVDFPVKDLDLTNYMPPLLPPNLDKGGEYTRAAYPKDDPRAQIPPYRYDLYAVTNHFGSLSSGHCELLSGGTSAPSHNCDSSHADTAFIASKGGWVYCDDSRLTNADPRDVVVSLTLCVVAVVLTFILWSGSARLHSVLPSSPSHLKPLAIFCTIPRSNG